MKDQKVGIGTLSALTLLKLKLNPLTLFFICHCFLSISLCFGISQLSSVIESISVSKIAKSCISPPHSHSPIAWTIAYFPLLCFVLNPNPVTPQTARTARPAIESSESLSELVKMSRTMGSPLSGNLVELKIIKSDHTCGCSPNEFVKLLKSVVDNKYQCFRVSDKKAAKTYNIRNFPALSLFRNGEPSHFEVIQGKIIGPALYWSLCVIMQTPS